MILLIDTTKKNLIRLALKEGMMVAAEEEIATKRNQNELLLPEIERLLKRHKLKMKDLAEIEVVNGEGSFSSLRLGIVTANALGYAFGLPVRDNTGAVKKIGGVSVVEPRYNGEANISGNA